MAFGQFINSILKGAPTLANRLTPAIGQGSADEAARAATGPAAAHRVTVESDDARTERALDELRASVRAAGRELPTVISSRLRQIDDVLRTVVDTIADQDASTEQRVLLAATVGDYIPTPLSAFLALPDSDRSDGSGATLQFSRQLGLLEETMRDLLNQIRIGAIAELSTHGRFLVDKFATPDPGLVLGGR